MLDVTRKRGDVNKILYIIILLVYVVLGIIYRSKMIQKYVTKTSQQWEILQNCNAPGIHNSIFVYKIPLIKLGKLLTMSSQHTFYIIINVYCKVTKFVYNS